MLRKILFFLLLLSTGGPNLTYAKNEVTVKATVLENLTYKKIGNNIIAETNLKTGYNILETQNKIVIFVNY